MTKGQAMKKKSRIMAIIACICAIIVIVTILTFLLIDDDVKKPSAGNEPVNEKFTFLFDEESTLIKNDDIFYGQSNIRKEYLDKLEKGNYTLDNPYVVVNPYLIAPQTALVLFETNKSQSVKVTVKGKHNDDLVVNFEAAKKHILPIYGLYGDYENTVLLETEDGSKKELKIRIHTKADTGEVKVLENKLGNSNGNFYFTTSSLGVGTIAYDNYGEVRWWLNIGYSKGMTMLSNGNILLSSANEGPDFTSTSGVVELDMMGYVHKEFEIEGGYHHDGLELENGNLIILTSKLGTDRVADHIVELDRKTGKIVKEWNLYDIVSKIDNNFINEPIITWGWINSIYYDKTSNNLLLSVRNRNSVVAIGYSDSAIKWILGEEKYWSPKFRNYLIKGKGKDFIYPAGQHSVKITDDGKLSIFNNGYDAFEEDTILCKDLRYDESYAIRYNLDLANKEATMDWSFGGKEYFSYALSSYTYSSDGHSLFNSGWHFTKDVDYSDPECTQFSNDKYDAYLIEFDKDNNILLKLHINESKFEAVKANIYNLEKESVNSKEVKTVKNYSPANGQYLSTYEPDKYTLLTEEDALKYQVNENCFITFQMYNKRFKLIGVVPNKMEMKVTFISPKGMAYQYMMKESGKDMLDFINVSLLPKGKYFVYVNMGEHVYNTTEYIEIN